MTGVDVPKSKVIDLDDSFENRNWLRIVALMKEGKTRQEAIDILKGRSGGPIAGHDVAQHGNEGLSNPVESYNKTFGKSFSQIDEHKAAVQNADTDTLPDVIDRVEKLPHGDHQEVQAELDAAKVHLTGAKLATNEGRKRHHLVEAKRYVMNGLGIMSTLDAR
jgi:hypothetical protein